MPRLKLNDRTYENDDGTWTDMEFHYCHPWANGDRADIAVTIKRFERKDDGSWDFGSPDSQRFFRLGEMEILMLHGFLGAAVTLMPRQWAEYQAQEAEEKARTKQVAE